MANDLTPELKEKTKKMITSMELEFARALPKHFSKDRFLRIIHTEISKNPKLLLCDKTSLLGSLMFTAQIGLEVGAHLGHCYLIPYKNKEGKYYCTVQYGYKGLIELSRRSNQIVSIAVENIYKNDYFVIDKLNNHVEHKPLLDGSDRGEHYLTVVVVKLKDGTKHIEYMTKSQIMKRKALAQSKNIWNDWEERMSEKTVLKAAFRLLPMSIEDQRIIGMDERVITNADNDTAKIMNESESIDYSTDIIETVEETKEIEAPKAEEKPSDEPKKVEAKAEANPPKPRANPLLKKSEEKNETELFGE